jgi:hypothetical protein
VLNEMGFDESYVRDVESRLIRAWEAQFSFTPDWNGNSGSASAAAKAVEEDFGWVASMLGMRPDPMVARATIRQLSHNATWARIEEDMHGVRLSGLLSSPQRLDPADLQRKEEQMVNSDEARAYLVKERCVP